MRNLVLTVVDTVGIQNYIFGTNSLAQNVGASYLVECATKDRVYESLPDGNNLKKNGQHWQINPEAKIENDTSLAAELVYSGGGNSLILFRCIDDARAFTKKFTRGLLMDAPGLRVVVEHYEFDWDAFPLGGEDGAVTRLLQRTIKTKSRLGMSYPPAGLSVTTECAYTGEAASALEGTTLISAEVEAKLKAAEIAHERLIARVDFHGFPPPPRDFEQLVGTRNEKRFIAVIHADGNRMGERVESLAEMHQAPGDGNRDYIHVMRAFSDSIGNAASHALQKTVDWLVGKVIPPLNPNLYMDHYIGSILLKHDQNNHPVLPFRPIVFGGDDITFVSDGRLGLQVAAVYLSELRKKKLSDGKTFECRAGVAVVKTHYPFSRAYDMAEELCASARTFVDRFGGSAIDWHFSASGMALDLKEIRLREYHVTSGKLNMRPVGIETLEWRSWENVVKLINIFLSHPEWADRHNKINDLKEALRKGPEAVANYCKIYHINSLPGYEDIVDLKQKGWNTSENTCGYFDAVEAFDLFELIQ